MRVRFLLVLLVLFLCEAGESVYASDLLYTDIYDNSFQVTFSPGGVSFGKILAPMEVCPETSDYICFNGGGLLFAIPKNINDKKSWAFKNATFNLRQRGKVGVLGQIMDILLVDKSRGEHDEENISFLFSFQRGLLGIGIEGEIRHLFLLENRCGFGADVECR